VGRAGRKAYAYLFIKSETSLTRDARKRLKALMDFTHLGAGFAIAMHDLQIRGAGNLLGEVQSGQAAEVGYELYVRMLEEAVARLGGTAPSEGPEPELHLGLPAHLPESYVPEPQVRLSLYKRLGRGMSGDELEAVRAEIGDRFGPPPEPVRNLLAAVELKALLRRMFAARMDLSDSSLQVHFSAAPQVDLERLLGLAEREPEKVTVYPEGKVSIRLAPEPGPLEQARQFLHYISGGGN
jgi:transcription-repair coupling factor (superfamily II helicase)